MPYLNSNQLKQYNDEGYIAPINILSLDEAVEARKEIELIEKELPNEIDKTGRYNVHFISPKLDALSLLPMFSHSSSSHSLLLSNKEEISVKIKNNDINAVKIVMDGKKNLKYSNNGLKIAHTKKTFKLYHPKDYNYFEACRTKLGWAIPIENYKND